MNLFALGLFVYHHWHCHHRYAVNTYRHYLPKFSIISITVTEDGKVPHFMWKCSPGGFFHQNHMWIILPSLENLTFSIPIFRPIPTYHYTILIEKYQIFPNLLRFAVPCSKYTQILLRKSTSKGRHIYSIGLLMC